MKVSEFTSVFERNGSFLMVIDSSKDYVTDAILEQSSAAPEVQQMVVDRIVHFDEPVLVFQWSDCAEDYHCGSQCSDVVTIFAHPENTTPKNTKLKSEIYDDIQTYVDELNARHSHEYEMY